MIPLLLALALGAQAQDAPGRLSGMWRAELQIVDRQVRTFPERLDATSHLWARQLWVFDDRTLTVATQIADHPGGPTPPRGGKNHRTTWCQAQITVPLTWVQNRDAQLPPFVRTTATGSRSAPSEPLAATCAVDLQLGMLRQVQNGPGMPLDAVTLASPDERVVYVLVPDGEPASLERFVAGD